MVVEPVIKPEPQAAASAASLTELMKLGLLLFLLLSAIVLPFCLWGAQLEQTFSLTGAQAWMRQFGPWAWLAGISLLVADVALPVPSTPIMSALGLLYGWFGGGLISALGNWLSGLVAYTVCKYWGQPLAEKISGAEALSQNQRLMHQHGSWLVALTRGLPVLPEALACLAGLGQMPARRFMLASACGALPVGFIFATIGHLGRDHPSAAFTLSLVLPAALWWLYQHGFRKKTRKTPGN
jgi:uncharacterized membrane protein YdjX (TVP38/TMEM64 family)